MAQIDIGKLAIGPHKGDYNNSTSYVANEIVYYNGSAYIAKTSTTGNLPTSTAHWNVYSAGSGGIWNSGLSIGSEGQVVKVSSGALAFGTVSSDYVKIASGNMNGGNTVSIDGYFSSTYDLYKLVFHSIQGDTDNQQLNLRVNTGGSADSSGNYYYSVQRSYIQSSTNAGSDNAVSNWANAQVRFDDGLENNSHPAVLDIDIYNPLSTSVRKALMWKYWWFYSNGAQFNSARGGLNWDVTTALTGVTLFLNTGSFESSSTTAKNAWSLYGIK